VPIRIDAQERTPEIIPYGSDVCSEVIVQFHGYLSLPSGAAVESYRFRRGGENRCRHNGSRRGFQLRTLGNRGQFCVR